MQAQWFLTAEERGNPASGIPAWSAGNRVQPLVHGATYFDVLVDEVEALGVGDYLFFTDWRGDPDELMRPDGPTVRELFSAAAGRGVVVKGLVWRSHMDRFQFSEEENQHLGEAIEAGRRRGAARPAGAHGWFPPSEAGGDPPSRRPGAGCGVRRRYRPVPQPPRRREPPR